MREYWWVLQKEPYFAIIDGNPRDSTRLNGYDNITTANIAINDLKNRYPKREFELVGITRLYMDE